MVRNKWLFVSLPSALILIVGRPINSLIPNQRGHSPFVQLVESPPKPQIEAAVSRGVSDIIRAQVDIRLEDIALA